MLESCGYKVLRFWNNEVSGNSKGVLDTIAGQLTASPRGERPREARVRERSA
jgi:very-short-patch-repair endonuclease